MTKIVCIYCFNSIFEWLRFRQVFHCYFERKFEWLKFRFRVGHHYGSNIELFDLNNFCAFQAKFGNGTMELVLKTWDFT